VKGALLPVFHFCITFCRRDTTLYGFVFSPEVGLRLAADSHNCDDSPTAGKLITGVVQHVYHFHLPTVPGTRQHSVTLLEIFWRH
jgi:hypothetical protein